MPSPASHAVFAFALAPCFFKAPLPKRVSAIGAVCSALPDLDVIGFHYGICYGDFWGHRGFTHSLVFAALLVLLLTASIPPNESPTMLKDQHPRLRIGLYLFVAMASHGFLDAMTSGGLGIAFFSPFDTHRYFFTWRPILVAPIGITRFFTPYGLAVLRSELLYVCLPSALLAASVLLFRNCIQHRISSA